MLAAKEVVHLASEPKVAEELAMRFRLQLARDTCFHKVEAESYCLDLVKALKNSYNENTHIFPWLLKIVNIFISFLFSALSPM